MDPLIEREVQRAKTCAVREMCNPVKHFDSFATIRVSKEKACYF